MNFTPEERETYKKMLADNSFDTGLDIFNDNLMSEVKKAITSMPTSLESTNDIFTEKTFRDLVKTVQKSARRDDIMLIGYASMREKIREAGFPIDDYRYVEVNSTFAPNIEEDQVWILPVKTYEPDIKLVFKED